MPSSPVAAEATSRRGSAPPTRSSCPERCRQSSRKSPSGCATPIGTVPSRRVTMNAGPSFRTTASARLTVAAAASVVGVLGGGCGGMAALGLPTRPGVPTPTFRVAERPMAGRADGMGTLRIAVLAPPWIPVPAPAYGGIEEVVRLLCSGLVDRGHDVTLFAPPSSTSSATVEPLLDDTHPDEIERCRWEVDHVARAFAAIDAADADGRPFDLLHDHTGYATLAM